MLYCNIPCIYTVAGTQQPHVIQCLAIQGKIVFASYKNVIKAFKRGQEVNSYVGHEGEVQLILPFGEHLVSIDDKNVLKIWHSKNRGRYIIGLWEILYIAICVQCFHFIISLQDTLYIMADLYGEVHFDLQTFAVTSAVHPSTYLNKILLGSQQGQLQLWNIRTSKLVYTFKGWGSQVQILTQSPAVDVVGVGLENGSIVIHNLKYDETVMKFHQEWGPVTTMSFRTGDLHVSGLPRK